MGVGYIVNEGEIPWWGLPQGEGRRRARRTQYFRAWRKGRRDLTHVGTPKTPKGFGVLYAPYKREPVGTCELCGTPTKTQALGWHHWVYENPSIGLWTCPWCNQFAEAVDIGGMELVEKYVLHKELLDRQYADGEIVREAKLAKQNRRICVMVNGLAVSCRALGKKDAPKGGLCELCGHRKYSSYHHWDNAILGKGIWVCMYDHALAERMDTYGIPFVERYMALKAQDEHRVSEMLLQQAAISLYNILPKQLPTSNLYSQSLKDWCIYEIFKSTCTKSQAS